MELMRVDFLANASHELRTPLASLTRLHRDAEGPRPRRRQGARDRFLDIMATQADRMSRLVADLLSLSRIELNEHIPPSGRVDLARAAVGRGRRGQRAVGRNAAWLVRLDAGDGERAGRTATATRSSR